MLKLSLMFDQRIKKVREELKKKNIDAFLISNFYNILYLTGFKTLTTNEREAFVLITKNKVFLFSDERYIEDSLKLEAGSLKLEIKLIEPGKSLISHLVEIVKDEEIKSFCSTNFSVSFPLFSKVSVKGEDICPLYSYLTSEKTDPGFSGEIPWNFTKFLVDRKGRVVARYEPRTTPDDKALAEQIEKALAAK